MQSPPIVGTIDTLEEDGYWVIEAGSSAKALALLEAGEIVELMVTDIRMLGEMDGVGLAWRVSKVWPGVAIIGFSAQPQPYDDDLPLGAAFLAKPATPAQVVAAQTAADLRVAYGGPVGQCEHASAVRLIGATLTSAHGASQQAALVPA